jgi:hypothetical protein
MVKQAKPKRVEPLDGSDDTDDTIQIMERIMFLEIFDRALERAAKLFPMPLRWGASGRNRQRYGRNAGTHGPARNLTLQAGHFGASTDVGDKRREAALDSWVVSGWPSRPRRDWG